MLLFLAICGLTEAKAVANDEGQTPLISFTGERAIRICRCGNICLMASRAFFEDPDNPGKYRAYIIGSHDVRFKSYCGADIRMWSAPVEDLSAWRDEGPIFTYQIGGKWDVMYAPDLVEVRRKRR